MYEHNKLLMSAREPELCPHCGASWEERGRHAYQGYCEACSGEPDHLEHIFQLKRIVAELRRSIHLYQWEEPGV